MQTQDKTEPAIIFYDGECGLCHRVVKFILPRDPLAQFRFAPLNGETFEQRVARTTTINLPDSIILLSDGRLLFESDAALAILKHLASPWPAVGWLLGFLPKTLRDRLYRLVAGHRKRLFKKPTTACPIVPDHYRQRFLS